MTGIPSEWVVIPGEPTDSGEFIHFDDLVIKLGTKLALHQGWEWARGVTGKELRNLFGGRTQSSPASPESPVGKGDKKDINGSPCGYFQAGMIFKVE